MLGPKKQDFWPGINILKGKNFKKILMMNDSSSKSAKIILSKSIFDVKNRLIFFFIIRTMACNGYDDFGRACVHKNNIFGFEYTCTICAPEALKRLSEVIVVSNASKKQNRQAKIRERRARAHKKN